MGGHLENTWRVAESQRWTRGGENPVFFPDSKVNFLLEWAGYETCEVEIDWRNQSGADSSARIEQAKGEMDDLVAKYGRYISGLGHVGKFIYQK